MDRINVITLLCYPGFFDGKQALHSLSQLVHIKFNSQKTMMRSDHGRPVQQR